MCSRKTGSRIKAELFNRAGEQCRLLGRHTGLPILELQKSMRAENDRGYKPLLLYRRSDVMPASGNSTQPVTVNSSSFNGSCLQGCIGK
jgi:hypothetical protein